MNEHEGKTRPRFQFGAEAVPAEACRFDKAEVHFGDNGASSKTAPVRLIARTGQPIESWFWGRCVHDMAGCRPQKSRLVIDYLHRDEEILGYLNKFEPSNEALVTSGALTPFQPDDRASEVLAKSRAGVPYEASIDFNGPGLKVEVLDQGQVAQVNGYQFEGPGVVFREWPLCAVAICPHGADPDTETQLASKKRGDVRITAFKKEKAVADKESDKGVEAAAPAAAVETPEKPVVAEAAPNAAVEATPGTSAEPAKATGVEASAAEVPAEKPEEKKPEDAQPAVVHPAESPAAETPPSDEAAKAKAAAAEDVKRFVNAFGEQGATWFGEGKTFEQAKDLLIEQLKAKVGALELRIKQVGKKFGLDEGDLSQTIEAAPPVGGNGTGKVDKNDLRFKVGDNLARFARGLKLPTEPTPKT